MEYRKLNDVDFSGKKVLVRVDFNVPTDAEGRITDNKRIAQAIPTISHLLGKGAKIILATHMGRPDGKVNEKYRLDGVAKELSKLMDRTVTKLDDCVGDAVREKVASMKPGDIVMLENLRFHPEEEANDENFAKSLAALAELYVNDAFGTCHRAHASVHAVTRFLPSAAGFLLEKEIDIIGRAIENPEHPFIVILGGAKVSDKIGVISNLLPKADYILIGGAMANTFLKATGHKMGASKSEDGKLDYAREMYSKSDSTKVDFTCSELKKIVLPWDVVCARNPNEKETRLLLLKNCTESVPDDMMALDVGHDTIAIFKKLLKDAQTVIWNGPLGYFENETFNTATREIAEFISTTSATSIIGGGDTAAAIEKYDFAKRLTHISTGGGASLEFIEGKKLPAIEALEENAKNFK